MRRGSISIDELAVADPRESISIYKLAGGPRKSVLIDKLAGGPRESPSIHGLVDKRVDSWAQIVCVDSRAGGLRKSIYFNRLAQGIYIDRRDPGCL